MSKRAAPARKPLLVFVPGLGATGQVYRRLLGELSSDYDVVSADHPLRLPERLDREFFFRPIDRAIRAGSRRQAGGTRPAKLLGHSMGGAVVLEYAARHRDKVAGTVAVAPILFPFKRDRHRIRETAMNALLWLFGRPRRDLRHDLESLRIVRHRLAGGRGKRLYDWAGGIDLSDDLPKLRRATILFPRHEEVIPREHFRRVEQEYPNVDCRTVSGSHHNIALSPRKLVPIIKGALDG